MRLSIIVDYWGKAHIHNVIKDFSIEPELKKFFIENESRITVIMDKDIKHSEAVIADVKGWSKEKRELYCVYIEDSFVASTTEALTRYIDTEDTFGGCSTVHEENTVMLQELHQL